MVHSGAPNPVDSILFKQYRDELEDLVRKHEKKRIYGKDEPIDLEPHTIYEIVRKLEHYDFFGIDEDLNGRLFETFLTATMRGQELGQFFTPRSVVKFMVRLADLQCSASRMDRVLDGCCGTGGFLIDAMAVMDAKLQANHRLSGTEREGLRKRLRTETLWGIDAGKDPPVARIARLNMLLHRDGGSRIYFADALDPELPVDKSLPAEVREEREELRKTIIDEATAFDAVLTNPPFSMDYEWKKPEERRILEKYSLAKDPGGKPRASLRSSVLFLERYWNLLRPGGKLLTIMDESVLNTSSMDFARNFVRDKFVVVAVISLPTNTFVKAGVSVKTSVLYLRKKVSPTETQPSTFMGISENVGHSDTGRPLPDQNDLPRILGEFETHMAGK